ncbi:unnamed protein product [Vitrella brassicaformis CCMP3155]|uniref:DEP domain-containing protein n=4 Tax=Vitrella brassicaformis TaxID=1169539 RepID=A0A0G4G0M6_VITBC|nr:unnamed protein product [Vitrella brassicaformis CCMP3155]|eukprot:CEM21551.1 unnamed protein product [Vitrella brassicaformis CCMP3155]
MGAASELATVLGTNFFAIGLGYAVLKLNYVTSEGVKGIGFIVGDLALPLLVFRAVALMDLASVDLGVLAACTIGKLIVQLAVVIATVLLDRSPSRWLRAGLFGLCVTASNDFALGVPVVMALYPLRKYPQNMMAYLTANAVVQTILLNTIAFVLFEYGKTKREAAGGHAEEEKAATPIAPSEPSEPSQLHYADTEHPPTEFDDHVPSQTCPPTPLRGVTNVTNASDVKPRLRLKSEICIRPAELSSSSRSYASVVRRMPIRQVERFTTVVDPTPHKSKRLAVKVASNLVTNPLLIMIVVGLAYKGLFGWTIEETPAGLMQLPVGLHETVEMTTSPFAFCALFLTGCSVVNNLDAMIRPQQVVLPVFLAVLKILVSPVLMHAFVPLLSPNLSPEDKALFSDFALLYGSIPTSSAPVVFAAIYKIGEDVAGAAVILGLFLGGPLIFLSSILFGSQDTEHLIESIWVVSESFAVASLVFACLMLLIFLVLRSTEGWLQFPRVLIIFYAASVAAAGALTCALSSATNHCEDVDRTDGRLMVMYWLTSYFTQMSRWWVAGICLNVAVVQKLGLDSALVLFWPTIVAVITIPLATNLPFPLLGVFVPNPPIEGQPCQFWFGRSEQYVEAALTIVLFLVLCVALFISLASRDRIMKTGRAIGLRTLGSLSQTSERSVFTTRRRTVPVPSLWARVDKTKGDTADADECEMRERSTTGGHGSTTIGHNRTTIGHDSTIAPRPAQPWRDGDLVFPAMVLGVVGGIRFFLLGIYNWAELSTAGPRSGSLLQLALITMMFEAGQGLLLFLLFAFQQSAIQKYRGIYSCLERNIRKLMYRIESPPVDVSSPLPASFVPLLDALDVSCNNHLELDNTHIHGCTFTCAGRAEAEGKEDRRWARCPLVPCLRRRAYVHCFSGVEMVDYLIDFDFASGREEGVAIGRELLRLGIISHVMKEHDFYDLNLFYNYTRPSPSRPFYDDSPPPAPPPSMPAFSREGSRANEGGGRRIQFADMHHHGGGAGAGGGVAMNGGGGHGHLPSMMSRYNTTHTISDNGEGRMAAEHRQGGDGGGDGSKQQQQLQRGMTCL